MDDPKLPRPGSALADVPDKLSSRIEHIDAMMLIAVLGRVKLKVERSIPSDRTRVDPLITREIWTEVARLDAREFGQHDAPHRRRRCFPELNNFLSHSRNDQKPNTEKALQALGEDRW